MSPISRALCFRGGGLLPVSEKLLLTFLGKRMFQQLFEHLVWHCGDIRAQSCRLDHVNRMAQASGQHFRLPTIVVVNLNDFLEQSQTVVADVVQATKERTDK